MSQQSSYRQRYLDRVSGNTSPEMATASVFANGVGSGSGNVTAALEELYRKKQMYASVVSWYNPVNDNVYITEVDDRQPHYDHLVYNLKAYKEGRNVLKTATANPSSVSKTEVDKAMYGAFEPEWQSMAQQYYDSQNMKTAGAITSKDFLAITTSVVQGELLDLDRRQYVLDQAVSTIRTDELEFEIDTYNRFQVAEDVAELELTAERAGQFTTQFFGLKKDQGHIAWTQTFNQRTRRQPVLAIHARNLQDDFDRIINKRIATVLATLSNTASGGAWDVVNATHGNSDFNPTDDFIAAGTSIRNNGGRANRVASNNKTYVAYSNNTFVKGTQTAAASATVGEAVYNNPPLLTGYSWYVDETLPDDSAYVYDVSGIIHIIGPRRTANYSKPEIELSGIVVNNFDNTVLRTSGFGVEITNTVT